MIICNTKETAEGWVAKAVLSALPDWISPLTIPVLTIRFFTVFKMMAKSLCSQTFIKGLSEALEAHRKQDNPLPYKHTLNFMEVSL